MSDIWYLFALFGVVGIGGAIIATLEWLDDYPPEWVVQARLRRHRSARK